jgi:hypothetical protein
MCIAVVLIGLSMFAVAIWQSSSYDPDKEIPGHWRSSPGKDTVVLFKGGTGEFRPAKRSGKSNKPVPLKWSARPNHITVQATPNATAVPGTLPEAYDIRMDGKSFLTVYGIRYRKVEP